MAYFDYICDKCEEPFEIQCGINEDRSGVKCPSCGGAKVRRNFASIYLPKKSGGDSMMSSGTSGGSKCSSCSSGNCASCG